jgi:hypothetical protein
MSLTTDQRTEIRHLHGAGVRWEVIAEILGVSRATIQNLTLAPPSPEEMERAQALLEDVRAEIWASEDSFGCYRGDGALFMGRILADSPFGPPRWGPPIPDLADDGEELTLSD